MKTNVGLILLSVWLLVCSSLCFVLWSLSVYSLSIPLFISLRPCSPRRNKENSLLFWFVLCLRFLPFVSVSWFFFQFSLCFLLPLHCFFRLCVSCSLPFVTFFSVPRGSFSLASSVSLRRNRGTKVCSWLSSRLCIMSVQRGKGVAQPETRLALLCWLTNAPHCFFFVSPVFSLSVPLVLFSSSPRLFVLSHLLWLYSLRMPSILAIETALSLYSRNGS